MINLLELFGLILICLAGCKSLKENDFRPIFFGALFFPIAAVWETLSVGKEWNYTAPQGAGYSFFLASGVPAAIPLGWVLSIIIFVWYAKSLKTGEKTTYALTFLLGFFWGAVLELFFVNSGYWMYLRYPQVMNIRLSAPIGWGLLALMCIPLYNYFLKCFGRLKENYFLILMPFTANLIGAFLWIAALKILSSYALDPLYLMLFGA